MIHADRKKWLGLAHSVQIGAISDDRQLQRKLESISNLFVCPKLIRRAMGTSFRWYWRKQKQALGMSRIALHPKIPQSNQTPS